MKIERLLVVLMALTVVLQAATLFRHVGGAGPAGRPQQAQAPPVADAPKGVTLDLRGLPSEGKDDAKVILVEFSDYECPFCARHATGVGEELKKKFIQTGKVRHVFINNPLPMHPDAKLLATGAICAGEQGHYWDMHDKLFSEKPKAESEIVTVAESLKLNASKFRACLKNSVEAKERIEKDMAEAKQLKFSGTPAFAVGQVDGAGKVVITKLIVGTQPVGLFEKTLGDALAGTATPRAD